MARPAIPDEHAPDLRIVGPGELQALTELCRRCLPDPPDAEELSGTLFAGDRPALVRGDPAVGVVATEVEGDQGFVKLLCVDPKIQGNGLGHRLLAAAEADLAAAGATSVTIGADAPYFLYPGVETTQTAMISLLERHHYARVEANFNMEIDLGRIPPDPGGATVAALEEHDALDAWTAEHWPNWRLEVLRALGKGTLAVSREPGGDRGSGGGGGSGGDSGGGYRAFCAYDVNRKGTLGPVAVRPDLMGKGAGVAALLHALHRMRAAGYAKAEVLWVGPVVPYARVGGRVNRVFFVYRRFLP